MEESLLYKADPTEENKDKTVAERNTKSNENKDRDETVAERDPKSNEKKDETVKLTVANQVKGKKNLIY